MKAMYATRLFTAMLVAASLCVNAGEVPNLLKGEGPKIEEFSKKENKEWYLHFYGTCGWMYGGLTAEANRARQILITKVPEDSAVASPLKLGDVLLGVNGQMFSKHPVYQFREYSRAATENDNGLAVIMWRKGWDKPRTVQIEPQNPQPDFTKGGTVALFKEGMTVPRNLGATGARGWIYGKSHKARQILITKVHDGSPADGVLTVGDVILGIGDKPFDSDARTAFGRALTQAETREAGGKLRLLRWRNNKTETITIQLNVMGAYGKTTPWACEKSQKIIDNGCAYIVRNGISLKQPMGIQSLVASLALLATGNENYQPIVKQHVNAIVEETAKSGKEPPKKYLSAWNWGYVSLLLSEYYLSTKDASVLPALTKYANGIALGQGNNGNWGHGMAPIDKFTGKPHGELGGYGALNQCSTICWMSLLLAKRCGVTNSEIERAIANGHKFLSYFVDMGSVTYGGNLTNGGFYHDDNGKTSAAAVAFSIYGDKPATLFCGRMTVASHQIRERGHTGNYWSMLWGGLGAVRCGQPAFTAFYNQESWRFDLERRWDGGFEYQGKIWVANGIDPKSGRQRGMSEHTTPHWDTTGARVLMYCLSRKQLAITGKDTVECTLAEAEVADTIEAGTFPVELLPKKKLEGAETAKLMKLLGSWSPVVRGQAALALSKKDDNPVKALIDMLGSDDRYARYGACTALRSQKSKAASAVPKLIEYLGSEDMKLQLYAVRALATTDDERAVTALLKMATREFPDDPYDIRRRYVGDALFGANDSLVEKTRTAKDRTLMLDTARQLMRSITGHCRTVVGQNLVPALTMEEARDMWTDIDYAFYSTATTYNTAIKLATLQLMADNRIEEGIDRCVEYLTAMRGHGSQDRVPKVLDILLTYKAHAKRAIPGLEKVADYFENRETDFPKNLSLRKAKAVRDTIKTLKAMDDAEVAGKLVRLNAKTTK